MQRKNGFGEDQSDLLASHIREHGRLYHRMAFSVLRSSDCAADACQQAFMQAWEKRHEIRGAKAIRPYLTRAVINQSYQTLRQARLDQKHRALRSQLPASGELGHAELFEQREMLVVALEKLPENVRLIVTLRAMHGLRGNEVSELLNVNAGEVSRRYQEGLDLMRAFLM